MTSELTNNLFYDNGTGEKPLSRLGELRGKLYDIFVYKNGTPRSYAISVSLERLDEELKKIRMARDVRKIVLMDFRDLPESLEITASLANLAFERELQLAGAAL